VTDGSYCKGRTLVDCLGGERAAAQTCENGCIVTPEGKDDFCLSEDNPFCLDQPDGAWCYSGLLVTCQAQRPQAVFACPFGCIEQEDEDDRCRMVGDGDVDYNMEGNCARFSGSIDLSANGAMNIDNQRTFGVWPAHQLGNCPHPWGTIAKNGCTITSLAAIYEYLGFTRSVDGRQGMNCVYENAWRQEHGGYAPCAGEPEPNRCCAVWNTNPPGVGLYGIGNDGFNHPNCISGNAADALRLALNAGAPVLAGVVWEPVPSVSQAWHWITIVGADEQGLIMLDPWGGFKGRPADGSGLSLGREYRITTFRVPYMTSQMGGGGSNIDGAGRPVAGDDLVSEKPVSESSVADPDDPDDPDDPADPEGGSGGCSTSNSAGSGSFGWLLGLLGLAWLRRRRRFRG
jgi:MYXO-CTERM domain-containing protein